MPEIKSLRQSPPPPRSLSSISKRGGTGAVCAQKIGTRQKWSLKMDRKQIARIVVWDGSEKSQSLLQRLNVPREGTKTPKRRDEVEKNVRRRRENSRGKLDEKERDEQKEKRELLGKETRPPALLGSAPLGIGALEGRPAQLCPLGTPICE